MTDASPLWLSPLLPSIVVIAAFALALGGGRLIAARRDRTRGVLMLVAAAVLIGNLLLWVVPV